MLASADEDRVFA